MLMLAMLTRAPSQGASLAPPGLMQRCCCRPRRQRSASAAGFLAGALLKRRPWAPCCHRRSAAAPVAAAACSATMTKTLVELQKELLRDAYHFQVVGVCGAQGPRGANASGLPRALRALR